MKHLIALTIMLLTAHSTAYASNDVKAELAKIDAKETACLDNEENQSMAGMKYCLGVSYEELEVLLNQVYKGIVSELKKPSNDEYQREHNEEALRRLTLSQRAWLKFRETNSELSGMENYGGSLEGFNTLGSHNKMTKDRILELSEVISPSL